MIPRAELTLRALVQRTGIPATTIHHYSRLGLLPEPERVAPNRFHYDERHVQALRLVRLLRERRRLPLDTIRRVLPDLLAVEDDAFRPAMWERVVATHVRDNALRARVALVGAARKAFARRGFAQVSVGHVCDAVGIAKGTLYRSFASKEELFSAAAEAMVDDAVRAFRCAGEAAPTPLDEDSAAAVLGSLRASEVALLLEVTVRGIQGHREHAEVAAGLAATLRVAIGERVAFGNGDTEGPERVLQAALARALRSALDHDGA